MCHYDKNKQNLVSSERKSGASWSWNEHRGLKWNSLYLKKPSRILWGVGKRALDLHLTDFSSGSVTFSPSESQLICLFNGIGIHQQQIQPFIYSIPCTRSCVQYWVVVVNNACEPCMWEDNLLVLCKVSSLLHFIISVSQKPPSSFSSVCLIYILNNVFWYCL